MALDSRNDMFENEIDGRDREITLGTSTILGIFFALALICALFFGFGYTVGRKSVPITTADRYSGADAYKPAAGSPATQTTTDQTDAPSAASPSTTTGKPSGGAPAPTPAQPATASPAQSTPQTQPAKLAPETVAVQPTSPPPPTPVPPVQAASGPSMVQIAAVSHQEDANLLLSTLHGRGYNVFVRQEQDKLFHVQIGPFATRKEADAMRQRLLADGYNAIIK